MDDNKEDQSLGKPIAAFRAKSLTRLIVAACGIIILCGGVWLFLVTRTAEPGAWVFTLALFVLALSYFLGKSSYLVCPGGIIRVRFGLCQRCRWNLVSEIMVQEKKQDVVTSRSCVIVTKNGFRMELNDLVHDFDGMLALIHKEAINRQIPWKDAGSSRARLLD